MIQAYSLLLLEKALNLALGLDEQMPKALEQLEGKVIQIHLLPWHWHFFMSFESGKILLLTELRGKADTHIYSSPMGLIRLSLLPASKARSIFHDGVRIEGDVQLGQQLKHIMDGMEIDWESHLARFTGDMVAYQVGSGVRRLKQRVEHAASALGFQTRNYVQEELSVAPVPEAVQDFFEDIDVLKLDVERLEAKINKLAMKSRSS